MSKIEDEHKLSVAELRWVCDPEQFSFESTAEVEPLDSIIGQERALKAINLGLKIKNPGFNIYAAGMTGTGKTSTIKRLLQKLENRDVPLTDKVYVHNFKAPEMPRAITFFAGQGIAFKKDIGQMITYLRNQIPALLHGNEFKDYCDRVVKQLREQQNQIISDFNNRIKKADFSVVQYQVGTMTRQDLAPIINNQHVPLDDLEKQAGEERLSPETLDEIKSNYKQLKDEMDTAMRQARRLEKEIRSEVEKAEADFCRSLIADSIGDLKAQYSNPAATAYLDEMSEHILNNLKNFKELETAQQVMFPGIQIMSPAFESTEYEVNVLVDNGGVEKSPVIIELTPNFKNLFGAVEREMDRSGVWRTDFNMIKPGALLRADGGYLIFNAVDALTEPGVWKTLKRILKNMQLEIQNYDPYNLSWAPSMKPEPFQVDVKVVMIGDNYLYQMLTFMDEDFQKLFKVKADFAPRMDRDDEHVMGYARFIRMLTDREKMKPFHKSGVAAVVEYGVRAAGRRNKMTARFSEITDILREANYYAEAEAADFVYDRHVEQAVTEHAKRVNMLEDRLQELIKEDILLIQTEGRGIGQINGLSVYNLGNYSFGRPTRITAEISPGRAGLINIEREAKLSGKTHDKGVLILEGYLRGKFGQNQLINMSASICFEQSYAGVDGDSASAAETMALLSCLSVIPLRQDIGVTGSIDQKGRIQAVGGVNEKVEGFYDVCATRGLTGTQGVIIPKANVDDLMLRKDVIEAISAGRFHVYAISLLDQGLEIMTGITAGKADKRGAFPPNTINQRVIKKLTSLARKAKETGTSKEKTEKSKTAAKKTEPPAADEPDD